MSKADWPGKIRALIEQHHAEQFNSGIDELPQRFALVEERRDRSGDVYVTLHDSPEEAATYYVTQEEPESWDPVKLVDFETDEVWSPVVKLSVDFEPQLPAGGDGS